MNNRDDITYDLIISRFLAWADASGEVAAAFIIGSRAREDRPADIFSDLDLVLVADDPDRLLISDDWLDTLGGFRISFDEYTVGGGRERRVLFDGALDVDFLLYTKAHFVECAQSSEFLSLFARGCRVLLDKEGLAGLIAEGVGMLPARAMMGPEEFDNLINNFWFHTVWAAKKLRRGELWVAKSCVDGYMKGLLREMIECHASALHGQGYETWHNGRFLEAWADPAVMAALPGTFAAYEANDIRRALHEMMELFRSIARETAAGLGFQYPEDAERAAGEWIFNLYNQKYTVKDINILSKMERNCQDMIDEKKE